jgi:hypothetical protein
MPNTKRANARDLPVVIESIGDQGQRVEHGYVWPADSTTVETPIQPCLPLSRRSKAAAAASPARQRQSAKC